MYGRVIGFEMGPGLLRRAPRGWLPARATALECRVRSHNYSSADGGAPEIETSFAVNARWRIEIAGREPYEVQEERDGPAWTAGGGLGGGNRWYKVRVRPQYGLMKDVAGAVLRQSRRPGGSLDRLGRRLRRARARVGARGAHPPRRGGALEPLRPDLGAAVEPARGQGAFGG